MEKIVDESDSQLQGLSGATSGLSQLMRVNIVLLRDKGYIV
jgi:hypothetical protein